MPAWLLAACQRHARRSCAAVLVLGVALGASPALVALAPLRAAFALAVACADVWLFSSFYCHTGFVFLHTSFALVLPASSAGRAAACCASSSRTSSARAASPSS